MGAASFSSKREMKRKRSAEPLRPDELARLRELLRQPVIEDSMDAGEVALKMGLKTRAILNMIRDGEAFPNAFKPSHNRVRIPLSDVEEFQRSRRCHMPPAKNEEETRR